MDQRATPPWPAMLQATPAVEDRAGPIGGLNRQGTRWPLASTPPRCAAGVKDHRSPASRLHGALGPEARSPFHREHPAIDTRRAQQSATGKHCCAIVADDYNALTSEFSTALSPITSRRLPSVPPPLLPAQLSLAARTCAGPGEVAVVLLLASRPSMAAPAGASCPHRADRDGTAVALPGGPPSRCPAVSCPTTSTPRRRSRSRA